MRSAPIDRKAATVAASVALVALGLLSLFHRDLLLQWQPAPKTASWRMPLALVSGVILVVAGVGLPWSRTRRFAALLGSVWIGTWAIGLHLPIVVASRFNVAMLLGLAECSAMAAGLAMLALSPDARRYKRVLVALFGVCAIVFGVSHFVYAEFTASMVPEWLPAHLQIAYLTGAIHVATGVGLLLGVFVPLAAWIEVSMMSAFVVLLHVPRVLAAPDNRAELTMLAIAAMLTASAWLVAASTRAALPAPLAKG